MLNYIKIKFKILNFGKKAHCQISSLDKYRRNNNIKSIVISTIISTSSIIIIIICNYALGCFLYDSQQIS